MAWWRALPRRERALVALAAVALAAALLARPVARLVWTDYALFAASPLSAEDLRVAGWDYRPPDATSERGVIEESLVDPWGRPWRYDLEEEDDFGAANLLIYSVGPDGKDDGYYGDEQVVRLRRAFGPLHDAPMLGVAIALLLIWCVLVLRVLLAPRAATALVEAAYAVVLASLPAAVAAALVFWNARQLTAALEGVVAAQLSVPIPFAVSATLALLLWLAALRLRLRLTPPDGGQAALVAWRGPALALVAALLLLGLTGAWTAREAESDARRHLLARACLGSPIHVREIAVGPDLDLTRAFARRASPLVRLPGQADALYDGLARVGADAVPLLARALEDSGVPELRLPSSHALRPWRHLRELDPTLDGLFDAIAARPEVYRGFTLAQSPLVASRVGRAVVAGALTPLLDDEGLTGNRVSATTDAGTTTYELRVCDKAVEKLSWLFDEPRPFGAPDWRDQTTAAWDAQVAKARAWAREGAQLEVPVAWVVVDVRGLTLVSGRSSVEVSWTGGSASSGSMTDDDLVVLGPGALRGAGALRVVDEATARAVEVPVSAKPGATTWVRVDLVAGTSETKVYPAP